MTVSTTDSVVQYTGTGVIAPLPIPFKFFANTDLVVTRRSVAGVTTTLVLNTDYTVTGAGNENGGTVTPTSAALAGELTTVARVMTPIQSTDLRNQGQYYAQTHEDVFDKLTMLIQQVGEGDSRSLKHPRDSEHYQAEARRIVNLEDPVDPQDAVTKSWTSKYIDSVSGLINNTTGIAYDGGTLFDFLRFSNARVVANLAALRLIASSRNQFAQVRDHSTVKLGGGGFFYYDPSDTTSTDNNGTVIVATDGGRWKRSVNNNTISVCDFGALGAATNDAPAIQAAINWAIAQNPATAEGAIYKVTSPPGVPMNIGTQLTIPCPIKFEFNGSMICNVPASSAVLVGGVTPTRNNTFYDIYIAGMRCSSVIGNTGNPTGITPAQCGIELRSVQFSRIRVDQVIAFKGYGVFLNSSNNVFSGQHIQDNDIILGQVAYNGIGIYAPSADAALGAVQVNRITVQNLITNFQHMLLGNPNGLDNNTNNNQVNVIAMESNTSGGSGVEIRGSFNDFYCRYSSSPIALVIPGGSNRVSVGNNFQTGATFFDNQTGGMNRMETAGPNAGSVPSGLAQVLGNTYTNSYGVPVSVHVTATLTPTSSVPASVTVRIGKTPALLADVATAYEGPVSTPATSQSPLIFRIPSGWCWQISTPDATRVALSSANLIPASVS